jgi:hypothetical protein
MGIKAYLCAFLGLTTWAVAADPALVEAARKEGSVTWYMTYIVDQSVLPMIAGFEKAHPGIKVQFVRQASADLVFRITNEMKRAKSRPISLMGIRLLRRSRRPGSSSHGGPTPQPPFHANMLTRTAGGPPTLSRLSA